jgi:phospholipid/cholesterol/gamma-HCH transport system substrate-binding protein
LEVVVKFRIRFAQQIVGVFVLFAAVSIIVVIVSMGANQRWFAKDYMFHSVFDTAEGLSVGMPITFKGFGIGRVRDITLLEDDTVRVDFSIQDTYYAKVVPNSLLQLVTSPIGLGGGLIFHQGRDTDVDPLPEDSMIPVVGSEASKIIISQDLVDMPPSGDSITRIIAQVEPVLRSVNTLLISVDRTLGHVNGALAGDQDEPLGVTLARVNSLLSEVETTLVETRRESTAILASVAVMAENFEDTSEALRDPTGLVPRLLDADGSIATFLDDNNALYNEIEAMLISVNATLDEVNELAGFVNGTQPQIAGILEESQEAIRTGQDVLEGLSNNPFIRGGITEELTQPTTFQSYRDAQF